ncbi:hypothetical protein PSN45_000583 [Yamadazyma tenuis]|uniref:Uncharacterized protein n=1 Tax=Candida tenuis (strain ATCC 10573 / BCRC 21748 / CBS 615 / JCM 9827 / NBRC 10315 / NRRL Y-1498 / VKM Y-70) TaxID=590646 RepID=G3B9H9_CANTC|nr:uncharacterized protein CANTEDRAFT_115339 [Yamadazyma tenuis ATCC 10573]EGV61890.1 hypothetical protein CANTEDRAFT_115339 [Yamadazyma tenuis ATCC 10573]WEJ93122.1 hypothetical protein PSN45_000583 [Yamadazyma tenuis]
MIFNETRNGLAKKFGIVSVGAICLAYFGKARASSYKQGRHTNQSDALVDSQTKEFSTDYYYPGKNEENGEYKRRSEYVGAGSSYNSRRPGDRLTMFKIFDRD